MDQKLYGLLEKRNLDFINNLFMSLFYKIFILFSGFKNYPSKGTSAFFLVGKKVYRNFKNLMIKP